MKQFLVLLVGGLLIFSCASTSVNLTQPFNQINHPIYLESNQKSHRKPLNTYLGYNIHYEEDIKSVRLLGVEVQDQNTILETYQISFYNFNRGFNNLNILLPVITQNHRVITVDSILVGYYSEGYIGGRQETSFNRTNSMILLKLNEYTP